LDALKTKLKTEGSELSQKLGQLKIEAEDGKQRFTEQLFRFIQSIPSPKAEPFKQWLAQVARQLAQRSSWCISRFLQVMQQKIQSKFKTLKDYIYL
jgi:hypothetical protein